MIQDIERIEFTSGMLEGVLQPSDLPTLVLKGSAISPALHKAVRETDILNCGGVYGNRAAGDPVEYDHLRIVLTDDVVEIELFNRGITLFTTDDEKIRRIHSFICEVG